MFALPGMQLIKNQVIGTVIAAVLKRQTIKRVQLPPQSGDYVPFVKWYGEIIPVHAVTQESYEFRADVTQHPVENGSPFSDHVILRPVRLNVSFQVSNYDGLGPNAELAKQAFDALKATWRARQPLGILTTHTFLDNMILESFNPDNEAPNWGALVIRATFQQVNPVALQSVQFSGYQVQGDMSGNSTKALGAQPQTQLSAVSKKQLGKKIPAPVTSKAGAFQPLTSYLQKSYGLIQ